MVCHITLWISASGTVDFKIMYPDMYIFNRIFTMWYMSIMIVNSYRDVRYGNYDT